MKTAHHRNPGPRRPRSDRTHHRVDQAGEFGAVRIYEGQLAALRWTGRSNSETGRRIQHMASQERNHNKVFDRLLVERRVRPTLLSPLWSVAGFALGAATALMGDKAAMACTVAVGDDRGALRRAGRRPWRRREGPARDRREVRDEEIEHRDEALAAGAEQAVGYEALSAVIKTGSGWQSGCRRGSESSERADASVLVELAVPVRKSRQLSWR